VQHGQGGTGSATANAQTNLLRGDGAESESGITARAFVCCSALGSRCEQLSVQVEAQVANTRGQDIELVASGTEPKHHGRAPTQIGCKFLSREGVRALLPVVTSPRVEAHS
jgi:hypothetical protein